MSSDTESSKSEYLNDSGIFSSSFGNELPAENSYNHNAYEKHAFSSIETVITNPKKKCECERIKKSELWYKSEYKKCKRSKLEILEKYYLNEKKWSTKINVLEHENLKLKEDLLNAKDLLNKDCEKQNTRKNSIVSWNDLRKLENEVCELKNLNEILRKQKALLVTEFQRSSNEKKYTEESLHKNKTLKENLENVNFENDLLKIENKRLRFEKELDLKQIRKLEENHLIYIGSVYKEIITLKYDKIQLILLLLEQHNKSITNIRKEEETLKNHGDFINDCILEFKIKSDIIKAKDINLIKADFNVKKLKTQVSSLEKKLKDQQYLYMIQAQEFNKLYSDQETFITKVERDCIYLTQEKSIAKQILFKLEESFKSESNLKRMNLLIKQLKAEHEQKVKSYENHIKNLVRNTRIFKRCSAKWRNNCNNLTQIILKLEKHNDKIKNETIRTDRLSSYNFRKVCEYFIYNHFVYSFVRFVNIL